MSYQSSSFGEDGCWNEDLSKGQKVEVFLKIYTIFLSFVNLHVVQKNEQAKLYL